MSNIRKKVLHDLNSSLKEGVFSLRDFRIKLSSGANVAHISFLPAPEYEFIIQEQDINNTGITSIFSPEQRKKNIKLFTVESPGTYKETQIESRNSIEECINNIPLWCERIHEELSYSPLNNKFHEGFGEFEKALEASLSNGTEGDKSRFTSSEITELTKNLDAFSDKIKQLQQDNVITKQELSRVQKELEDMKGTMEKYPKNVWYKTSGHKILDTLKRIATSKEGKTLLLSTAKKILGLP